MLLFTGDTVRNISDYLTLKRNISQCQESRVIRRIFARSSASKVGHGVGKSSFFSRIKKSAENNRDSAVGGDACAH